MKNLGRISVLLAGALLMFHTLTPHQHHTELNPKEHIIQHRSADSLFDFIKLALHLDQGEGHLENYQLAHALQFSLVAVTLDIPSFLLENVAEESLDTSFPVTQEAIPKRFEIYNLRFRGPPAQA